MIASSARVYRILALGPNERLARRELEIERILSSSHSCSAAVCARMFADKDESERRPRLICASISRRRRRRRLASGSCEALSSRASGFSCAREFERRRENSQKLGQPLAAVGQLPARRSPLGAHFCHEQMRRLSRRLAFESLWRAESLIESARAAKAAPASSSPPRAVMDFVTCENNETARR